MMPHVDDGVYADAWDVDVCACDVCGRDSCEDHLPPEPEPATAGIPDEELEDAVDVARRGRAIDAVGVPYVLDGIIPAYGMLGFLVAYAKVGKTTFGQQLAAHVAMGRYFLDRETAATKVLMLAPEDPPEYTAWLARTLDVERGRMLFRCRPLIVDPGSLTHITTTIARHQIGMVLIASWQAIVRGLIKDENDNAGAVRVVEDVKAAARLSGIPWLIDAHSGKGEDQGDEADPLRAMRGASAAAGAADYMLSLRYGNGTFGTERRLSGKGRFVSFAPLTLDFDPTTGAYTVAGGTKDVTRESTWQLVCETAAITATPRSVTEIARAAGLVTDDEKMDGATRRRVYAALRGRPDVLAVEELRRGQKATLFYQVTP
jgi:hypothetical protein